MSWQDYQPTEYEMDLVNILRSEPDKQLPEHEITRLLNVQPVTTEKTIDNLKLLGYVRVTDGVIQLQKDPL